MNAEARRADIAERLTAFARSAVPDASALSITVHERSGEGDSHENWLCDMRVERDGSEETWPLVLRRQGQSIAAESCRAKEFGVLKRLHAAGFPVPEPLWLDADGSAFGKPAFVMRRRPGRSDLCAFQANNIFGLGVERRVAMARDFVRLMARLHQWDWQAAGMDAVLPVPAKSQAQTRLDAIVSEIERNRLEPYPEWAEAIAWLRHHMPPDRPHVMTHGDFRSVQILYDDEGNIQSMLDWEFARLTSPVDEVAYFVNPTAAPFHLIPGAWSEEDFLNDYEAATGAPVDRDELHWWKVLNMLWVMGFLTQSIAGIIEGRTDAVRTNNFNHRLYGMLQDLLDKRGA